MTTVLFHADAGVTVGLGHVRRCLALGEALAGRGCEVRFLVDQSVAPLVERTGFRTVSSRSITEATRDVKGVVIDSYSFHAYEELVGGGCCVIALDDLGRTVHADLVINGACGAESLAYARRNATRFLLGSRYALLRSAFAEPVNRRFEGRAKRALITIGGSDVANLTQQISESLAAAFPDVLQDIVVGPLSPSTPFIATNGTIHRDPADMHTLMMRADFAISGGGQTLYELAATETPTVAVRIAPNQTFNVEKLEHEGAIIWAADAPDADVAAKVAAVAASLVSTPEKRRQLGMRGRELVDGRGADRVASVIKEILDRT